MYRVGVYKANGNRVVCFTCIQCDRKQLVDFKFYPICKKCNKINTKVLKIQEEKGKNGENS